MGEEKNMKLSSLFLAFFAVAQGASKYPRGNATCDHGRKMLCKYCGESCGQARCPEDPKPEDYKWPDQFPDCNWACYCPDGMIWSPAHNECKEGEYDDICNGPGYYTYKVIPTYRQSASGWKEIPIQRRILLRWTQINQYDSYYMTHNKHITYK